MSDLRGGRHCPHILFSRLLPPIVILEGEKSLTERPVWNDWLKFEAVTNEAAPDEHVFPFPESSRNSNLIPYADLHRRGNEHVPLTLSSWLELPNLPIAIQRHRLTIRFPHGPLVARPKASRATAVG